MGDRGSALVVGATGLVGRAVATALAAAGMRVEGVARRAPSRPCRFPVVACDRGQPYALRALFGRARYTAVIDCCLSAPADLPALSAVSCDRYIFMSSGSVYDHRRPGAGPGAGPTGEDAPLVRSLDGALSARTFERQRHRVELEEAVRTWAAGRCAVTALRLGVVLGPGDRSMRLTHWRVQLSSSDRTDVPDDAVVSFVDARDLAALLTAELGRRSPAAWSVLNVGGPPRPQAPRLLDIVRLLVRFLRLSEQRVAPISSAQLLERGVTPWSEVPLWAPPGTATDRLMMLDSTRAQAAGLDWRPWTETVIDSMEAAA
jgi:2'-hydroxyisoflavone reductase